jgi:hypothetical protein
MAGGIQGGSKTAVGRPSFRRPSPETAVMPSQGWPPTGRIEVGHGGP